jgi:hypothetical protein
MWTVVSATVGALCVPFLSSSFRRLFVLTVRYKKNPVIAYYSCLKVCTRLVLSRCKMRPPAVRIRRKGKGYYDVSFHINGLPYSFILHAADIHTPNRYAHKRKDITSDVYAYSRGYKSLVPITGLTPSYLGIDTLTCTDTDTVEYYLKGNESVFYGS